MTNEQAIEELKSIRSGYDIGLLNAPEIVKDTVTALEMAIEALSAQPEIIRCKDCWHYPSEYADCPMIGWPRNENDFCSKAERKDDD